MKNNTFQTHSHSIRGQALVLLLIFVGISIIITTSASIIMAVNALTSTTFQAGIETHGIAETGAENAILRLLRDPNYAGETLTIGSDHATVIVTGAGTKTITSVATSGSYSRTVTVTAVINSSGVTIQSWKQTF
ncbi:hypothetical protein HY947_03155 [Candidatus Gottesmanbacteria bacterium]|nr:hypothetical protein [Candidatus Gottesmanbacteria bacterium]